MRLKYVIATAANYIPALCACLFFRGGGPVMFPLLIALQIILTLLNFFIANSKKPMIFLSANLFVSTIIANVLSTYLYYTNISSDSETILVGEWATIIGAGFVFILSLIFILLKRNRME